MTPKKVVVLLSGGLDSNVALASLVAQPLHEVERVFALIFDYMQSSRLEIERARQLCIDWGIPSRIEQLPIGDKDTTKEIPARNLMFIARAAAVAKELQFNAVAIGAEPDSTYTDSSPEFLSRCSKLLELFDLELLAPVKELGSKKGVIERALELGVPLHLCHSSRSNKVDGLCKTSALLLKSLSELFPGIEPRVLLDELARLETIRGLHKTFVTPQYKKDSGELLSFKYPAALFVIGSPRWAGLDAKVDIHTTGSWGEALTAAAQFSLIATNPRKELRIIQTSKLQELMQQPVNCNWHEAQWGIKQAMSGLPRARYLAGGISCKITQGHLAHALLTLGYKISPPASGFSSLILETSIK